MYLRAVPVFSCHLYISVYALSCACTLYHIYAYKIPFLHTTCVMLTLPKQKQQSTQYSMHIIW